MISDFLSLFNQKSEGFRTLIYDSDKSEVDPVLAIKDINKGAIHNILEYTSRWKDRTKIERSFKNATGFMLDSWGQLFGIPRNSDIDSEYREFILDRIFPPQFTIEWVRSLFPDATVRESNETGFFLDDSYLSDTISIDSTGSVMTALSNAIYIIFEEATDIDWDKMYLLGRNRVAGVAVYIGWVRSGIYEYLFLDDGFLSDGYISAQDNEVLNPTNEPEYTYFNQNHLDDSYIGE